MEERATEAAARLPPNAGAALACVRYLLSLGPTELQQLDEWLALTRPRDGEVIRWLIEGLLRAQQWQQGQQQGPVPRR